MPARGRRAALRESASATPAPASAPGGSAGGGIAKYFQPLARGFAGAGGAAAAAAGDDDDSDVVCITDAPATAPFTARAAMTTTAAVVPLADRLMHIRPPVPRLWHVRCAADAELPRQPSAADIVDLARRSDMSAYGFHAAFMVRSVCELRPDLRRLFTADEQQQLRQFLQLPPGCIGLYARLLNRRGE